MRESGWKKKTRRLRPTGVVGAVCTALLAAWSLPVLADPAAAPTIRSVSPQGEVAQVTQVAVGFSAPVVAFGESRLPAPMAVSCVGATPAGSGRWTSERDWVYQFDEALPPGVGCTVQVRSDWRPSATPTQAALGGTTVFRFNTGGPAVLQTQPYEGSAIEEDAHFLLTLNGPATERSIAAQAACEVEGLGERLPVRVVTGEPRERILRAAAPRPAGAAGKDAAREAARLARLVVVSCPRPLPADTPVRLVWGRGIASATNPAIATRSEQVISFRVRAAFAAEFSCERERANAPCLPIRPLTLGFSAPIDRRLAEQIRLVPIGPAGGAALAPLFDADDKSTEVSVVTLAKRVAENARYRVELPANLADATGRPLANAGAFPLEVAAGDAPPIAKFAAAPFGVLERFAEADVAADAPPMVPLTLRHVHGDLRPAAPGGAVRIKRLASDAEVLTWYDRLQRHHESQLTAQQAGLPKAQWFTTETRTDEQGRVTRHRVEREVETRTLSLLKADTTAKRLELPQLQGGDPRPFEVVGIPITEPGYHVIEIESARLGQSLLDPKAPMYVRTGVLVTNLGVHVKLGRTSSAVWVTSLDRGRPIEGAEVAINDCLGQRVWAGRSDARGLALVPQALNMQLGECPNEPGYFVTARKADADRPGAPVDMAFVFTSWQKGIESWRFDLPTSNDPQRDAVAHTVFDRTLLRAGETVSMKHFLRAETERGVAGWNPAELPTRVKLVHTGSGQEVVIPLKWNGVRHAVSTWNIPPAAKLGRYEVVLERDAVSERQRSRWPSGDFRVEEFRLPLVDARLSTPADVPIAPRELPLGIQLSHLSGGAMAQAPVQVSALLAPRTPAFAGLEGFGFEPPRAVPSGDAAADPDSGAPTTPGGRLVADKLAAVTDAQGAGRLVLKDLPAITRASQLQAELTYDDPNGERQTVSTRIDLWPSAVVLGIKTGSWVSERGRVAFSVVALDTRGQPIRGQRVEVRGRVTQTLSSRTRIVGGFYAYDNRTEVQELGTLCSGTTDERGRLACDSRIDRAGEVELIARAQDAAGRAAEVASSVWITRQGELWFAQDNDDRIDVLPEKPRYEPGETARLQVRMPYREATALVSIEREGMLDTRVVTLRGNDPTVSVRIEPAWGPNVYVSVLVLRGRLRDVGWASFFRWGWREPINWARAFWYDGRTYRAPTAMVDLAKPSFKLGVAALQVGTGAHELKVAVRTDRPQYAVRQTVQAHIEVTRPGTDGKPGGPPPAGTEVAFAAVDESLLELRPNASWDLLNAMFRTRPWGVETSTAQSELIGRRHYGRKAVAAGGGGGRGGTRELFDTLLLWKAVVPLDAQGRATVVVPLNDSLTRFRLVAVADAPADANPPAFGSGSTTVRVTQDLQLLPGLPPLVRAGDRFNALLTLRNTTEQAMTVRATLAGTANRNADGATASAPERLREPLAFAPQDITLAAGAAQEVVWPVAVPADAFSIVWEAAVQTLSAPPAGSGAAVPASSDRVKLTQLVAEAVPLQVTQATLMRLDRPASLPVAAPADALPSGGVPRGGVRIGVQPRLGGALPGLRRYFETYPYGCLEQKAARALGLRDAALWQSVVDTLPGYLDGDGLANFFPPGAGDVARGDDRLTAQLLATAHEAGFEWPMGLRQSMLDGLAAFVDGRIERRPWAPASAMGLNLQVRKLAALDALARHGRVEPRMLGSIRIAPNGWPTAAVIDWLNLLQRLEQQGIAVPDHAKHLAQVRQILRSRLALGGTTLVFADEAGDSWWWLMDHPDANAARLVLAVLNDPAWRDELPRLVQGTLGRQRQGAWATTAANVWGSIALDRFATGFEAQAVTGQVSARLESSTAAPATAVIDWAKQPAGGAAMLAWPGAAGTLTVTQQGGGTPWLTVQSLAAVAPSGPIQAGYRVTRSLSAVSRKDPARWTRGDVVRVRLEIDAQADRSWVVVSDPVPGGATLLGSGLGRDSAIATTGEAAGAETAWVAYDERSVEAFRRYYGQLPRGRHVVEYTLRLNASGRFALPPTRVEAMYAPETFGELPNAALEVAP